MSQHAILRPTIALALAITATTGMCASASARPDEGPHVTGVYVPTKEINNPVERIGSQILRGDNLTGAGAAAPLWLPQV
jgi:hypothetical protein